MRFFNGSLFILAILVSMGFIMTKSLFLLNGSTMHFLFGGLVVFITSYVGSKLIAKEVCDMRDDKVNTGVTVFGALLLGILCWLLGGCAAVQPGNVGIEINMAGDSKGVTEFPIKTGWVFYMPLWTKIVHYPVSIQTVVWSKNPAEGNPLDESITFTTKDQLSVNADVSLSYQLRDDHASQFYIKFRADDISTFAHGFLHNVARDSFNEEGGLVNVETIMGDNGTFLKKVRADVQEQVKGYGVEIQQFEFVGAPRPPENVREAINAKAQAQQNSMKVENEVKTSRAEAEKTAAIAEGDAKSRVIRAEGEAKANTAVVKSITPELLEWFKLQNQKSAIDKWDGKQPLVVSDSSGLLLQLPVEVKK